MKQTIEDFIAQNRTLMYRTLQELCAIPAPSHHEAARAQYCLRWLEREGATGAYIDGADNVILPIGCAGSNDISVFAAHTDTVFPDTEPMPYHDDGERVHCPGAADDTAGVTVLLLMAKFFIQTGRVPAGGVMFVCNSGEEGLGDLKGCKRLFADFAGRIGRFITFDSQWDTVSDRCVGSHRYRVQVQTEGGHSFGDFGKDNAIALLARLVEQIYRIEVPQKEGSHTTYNVGSIEGGTSVNTIAQSAEMLCEYRSDDVQCLRDMQQRFERLFDGARASGVNLCVTRVGERPCADIGAAQQRFVQRAVSVIERVIGQAVTLNSASTDCNVPLSLGIPALCMGVSRYQGMHTRQEWVDKASMLQGLRAAIEVALEITE